MGREKRKSSCKQLCFGSSLNLALARKREIAGNYSVLRSKHGLIGATEYSDEHRNTTGGKWMLFIATYEIRRSV